MRLHRKQYCIPNLTQSDTQTIETPILGSTSHDQTNAILELQRREAEQTDDETIIKLFHDAKKNLSKLQKDPATKAKIGRSIKNIQVGKINLSIKDINQFVANEEKQVFLLSGINTAAIVYDIIQYQGVDYSLQPNQEREDSNADEDEAVVIEDDFEDVQLQGEEKKDVAESIHGKSIHEEELEDERLADIKLKLLPSAPSASEAFLAFNYLLRLQSKHSKESFDHLLTSYKEQAHFQENFNKSSFELESTSTMADSNTTSQLPGPPSARLPSNESQLRAFLKMKSIEDCVDSFHFTQCSNEHCGKLYNKEEYKKLQTEQLEQKLISHPNFVFCDSPECPQTPLNYDRPLDQTNLHAHEPVSASSQPIIITQISSLRSWLEEKLKSQDWADMLDVWKHRNVHPLDRNEYASPAEQKGYSSAEIDTVRSEIWDGTKWKSDPDLRDAKQHNKKSPIMITLYGDGFNPHKNGNKSIFALFITIDNIPIQYRYHPSNVLLYSLIPGKDNKQCSLAQLEKVTTKLVSELKDMYYFETSPESQLFTKLQGRKVKLFKLNGDQPAIRHLGGFSGVACQNGCPHCVIPMNNFAKKKEGNDPFYNSVVKFVQEKLEKAGATSSNFTNSVDISQWKAILDLPAPHNDAGNLRTGEQVRREMLKYAEIRKKMKYNSFRNIKMTNEEVYLFIAEQKSVVTRQEEVHQRTGIRWTPFIELDYYDPVECMTLDVMHNVFLGVVKKYIQKLISVDNNACGLTETMLGKLNIWLKSAKIPADIGRMPSKWSGELGHFKAIEWSNFICTFALPALSSVGLHNLLLLPLIPLQRFSFLLRQYVLTEKDIVEIDLNIRAFYALAFFVCGPAFDTPNMHLMLHIPDMLRKYGPACQFWSFPYERLNGVLNQYTRKESAVVSSMMRSWFANVDALNTFLSMKKSAELTERALVALGKVSPTIQVMIEGRKDVLSIPTLKHIPSSFYYQTKIKKLNANSLNLEFSNIDPSSLFQCQSRQRRYLNMIQWLEGHDKLVKGHENILYQQLDSHKRLCVHVLGREWHIQGRSIQPPPDVQVLTPDLLSAFYKSKYGPACFDSSHLSLTTEGSCNVPVTCYRQMNICGAIHGTSWLNKNKGLISSFFADHNMKNIVWYGQIQFFFSHVLLFTNLRPGEMTKVTHTFAFVKWFKPADHSIHSKEWSTKERIVSQAEFGKRVARSSKPSNSISKRSINSNETADAAVSAGRNVRSRPFDLTNQESSSVALMRADDTSCSTSSSTSSSSSSSVEAPVSTLSKSEQITVHMKHQIKNHEQQWSHQTENIVANRLNTSFPLMSTTCYSHNANDLHTRILPIARIHNIVCSGMARDKNNCVMMSVPSRRHL